MSVRYSFVQWLRPRPFAIFLSAALSLAAPVSKAESLREALTAAYLFNPTLKAARAQLRSADNGVALAKAGFRPQITALASAGRADVRNRWQGPAGVVDDPLFSGSGPSTPRTLAIAFRQNVFDGFRTLNAVKGAEATVEAGREDLRGAEQSVLLNAATAYAHVVRDQTIVQLRQDAVREFARQLVAVRQRFQFGGVSQTDVFQIQTALASAEADLSIARGTLDSSRAQFSQYIGHSAGTLQEPAPAIRLVPASFGQASTASEAENPGILAAIFRERAQGHRIKEVKGQLLPSLSLDATYGKGAQDSSPYLKYSEDSRVLGVLNVPLYEGGSVAAQIRGAIETQSQLREQIDEARERARERVSSAWGLYQAAMGNIAAGRRAVEAARLTVAAIRGENALGQKGTSDVIGAEQTYLNVRVALVSYRSDLVTATYTILEAMGRLDAYSIALEAEIYDPTRYYGAVKDAWYGWGASVEGREDPRTAPLTSPAGAPPTGPVSRFAPFDAAPDFTEQAPQLGRGDPSPGRGNRAGNTPSEPERQVNLASNSQKLKLSRRSQSWTAQTAVESLFARTPEKHKQLGTALHESQSRTAPALHNDRSQLLASDGDNRALCASAARPNQKGSRMPCSPAKVGANTSWTALAVPASGSKGISLAASSAKVNSGTSWAPSLLPAVHRPAISGSVPLAQMRANASGTPSLLPVAQSEASPHTVPQSTYDRDGQGWSASAQRVTIMSRTSVAAKRWSPGPLTANSGHGPAPGQAFSN
jgi:outer membrane protein